MDGKAAWDVRRRGFGDDRSPERSRRGGWIQKGIHARYTEDHRNLRN